MEKSGENTVELAITVDGGDLFTKDIKFLKIETDKIEAVDLSLKN